MKKILLFLIFIFFIDASAQYQKIMVVPDTTILKATEGNILVLLTQFAAGNTSGGGLFSRIDSTYAEGKHAFDYSGLDGLQWARIGLIDQYVEPTTTDNTALIWDTDAYSPVGLDSVWTLINEETDSSLTYYGTIIAQNDNTTSFRVKGLNINGNLVQSYMGIFYSTSFLDNARLGTRTIFGGNDSTDLELQSSSDLLLSAVTNGNPTWGAIIMSASDSVTISTRTISDLPAEKRLIFDRVDKTTVGSANTSDVEIAVSSGNMSIASPILIQDSMTATDSTTSVILKSSDNVKWKIRVSTNGTVSADSTGLN